MAHVEDLEPASLGDAAESEERPIENMLMINRVEDAGRELCFEPRELEDGDAGRREARRDRREESARLRDVTDDVVADDEIGRTETRAHFGHGVRTEERDERGNATFLERDTRHVFGGLDAEHIKAARAKAGEQRAVVARDLEHARAFLEIGARKRFGHLLDVRDVAHGIGREVRVVTEQVGRRDDVFEAAR